MNSNAKVLRNFCSLFGRNEALAYTLTLKSANGWQTLESAGRRCRLASRQDIASARRGRDSAAGFPLSWHLGGALNLRRVEPAIGQAGTVGKKMDAVRAIVYLRRKLAGESQSVP